jgi:hypothetical protein
MFRVPRFAGLRQFSIFALTAFEAVEHYAHPPCTLQDALRFVPG